MLRLASSDTAAFAPSSHGALHHGSLMPHRGLYLTAMATGTVDFFNDTGGYGFIETEDADDDVFFHMEDVGGPDLEEGQELEFEIEDSPKGPRATNVVRL
jgi:CspA family cold shock protein